MTSNTKPLRYFLMLSNFFFILSSYLLLIHLLFILLQITFSSTSIFFDNVSPLLTFYPLFTFNQETCTVIWLTAMTIFLHPPKRMVEKKLFLFHILSVLHFTRLTLDFSSTHYLAYVSFIYIHMHKLEAKRKTYKKQRVPCPLNKERRYGWGFKCFTRRINILNVSTTVSL